MVPKHLGAPAAMQAEQPTMPWREKRDSHAAQGPGFSPNNWLEEEEKIVCKSIMEKHQHRVINNRQDITCRPHVTGLWWGHGVGCATQKCLHGEANLTLAPVDLHLLYLYTEYPAALWCCWAAWPLYLLTVGEVPVSSGLKIQVLFPRNILYLFVAPREFSFPCFLDSFLIFPGQLRLLFHTIFKVLRSYLKWVHSLAIEICHLKLPFTEPSPLHTDHSFHSMGSAIQHLTSLVILYHSS